MKYAKLIPEPFRSDLIIAGEAGETNIVDGIRERLMKAHPELFRFPSTESEMDYAKMMGLPLTEKEEFIAACNLAKG